MPTNRHLIVIVELFEAFADDRLPRQLTLPIAKQQIGSGIYRQISAIGFQSKSGKRVGCFIGSGIVRARRANILKLHPSLATGGRHCKFDKLIIR